MGADVGARLFAAGVTALVLCAGCGGAQQTESSEEREARQAALIRQQLRESWTPPVLLWQVAAGSTGLSEPSWIFASLPYGSTLHDALPEPHDRVVARATRMVLEVDPGSLELPALYETYHLGRRDRLDRMLGTTAWGQLRAEMGGLLPDTVLRQLQPWVLALHVGRIRMAEAEATAEGRRIVPGAASTASVSNDLLEQARRRGIETAWLDPDPATYIADFEEIGTDHWVLALREELEAIDVVRARMTQLREAYASRDETRIREACTAASTLDPEAASLQTALVAARARRWLPVVEQHARRGSTLIAVDACTLLQDDGLLAQLYGTGLRLQRLGAPPGTERP
ncbi:MAG: hypothetical protein OHK0013_12580 [Sandaracinaceae bacterium]